MRQTRRQRAARRHEAWAARLSDVGQHAWAIDAANDAVRLLRPVAEQHPAAMARALATRAACLHIRGRTADAARDVEECLAYQHRARGPVSRVDLARVAELLYRSGRSADALALAEQLTADARALPDKQSAAPMVAYGQLLLWHERAEEAVVVLREAYAAAPALSTWRIQASALLFEALGAAGRSEELRVHAYSDLGFFAANAMGSLNRRIAYIRLLKLLERHNITLGRTPPTAMIARQRRKVERQLRRRHALTTVIAVLTGRRRILRARPRTPTEYPLTPERAAALARVAQAEAEVERCRGSDDPRTLSTAWGKLAEARWHAGGQRSAALEAQRAALAAARQWATARPDEARTELAVHLRRFADYAGTIGLRTDAQLAQAEAEQLDPSA